MDKDVIIILAGGVNQDGSLPEGPKLRVEKGVELFKEGVAPRIIMSGRWAFWTETDPARTEASAMKEYAESLGVPSGLIFKEEESADTVGNAYFCRINFLDPQNWKNIVVVTSDYHIPRTEFIFEKVLGPEYSTSFESVDSKLPPEELEFKNNKESKTIEVLKDWIKDIPSGNIVKIKELLYTKHPGYAKNPEISKEQLLKMLGRE